MFICGFIIFNGFWFYKKIIYSGFGVILDLYLMHGNNISRGLDSKLLRIIWLPKSIPKWSYRIEKIKLRGSLGPEPDGVEYLPRRSSNLISKGSLKKTCELVKSWKALRNFKSL